MVAIQAALLAADATAAAAVEALAALAAGIAPTAPRAVLPVATTAAFLFLFLPLPYAPLLDGVEPDGPRRLFRDRGGLELFTRGAGILREPIDAGPVANGDGVSHAPRQGRLGGSLLLLEMRHLDPPW